MATKYTITKEQLIEFGMEENPGGIIYPMIKNLGKGKGDDGEKYSLDLVLTREHNTLELALTAPGCTMFLGGVQNIEDLKVIERCITSFEPEF